MSPSVTTEAYLDEIEFYDREPSGMKILDRMHEKGWGKRDRSAGEPGKRNRYWDTSPLLPDALPCCPGGEQATYREDDATNPDIWNAPTHAPTRNGAPGRLNSNSRYLIHERRFFHSIGIHDDEVIAKRLGVSLNSLTRLLHRTGHPVNLASREKMRVAAL